MAKRVDVNEVEHKMAVAVFYSVGGWLAINAGLAIHQGGISWNLFSQLIIGLCLMGVALTYHYASVAKIIEKISMYFGEPRRPMGIVKDE